MIRVLSEESSLDLALSLIDEIRRAGFEAQLGIPTKGDIVVALLSRANADNVPDAVIAALDLGLHIVVIKLELFNLPKLIDHLPVVSIADPAYRDLLRQEIERLANENAHFAVKVRTPKVKQSNRSFGVVVAALALLMFVLGLIGVGIYGIQVPVDEYDAIDTEVALTRDFLAGPELFYFSTWLPRSTQDAENYQSTLQQLPTAYRPLMGLTVTAYAQGTPLPPITTPVPGE